MSLEPEPGPGDTREGESGTEPGAEPAQPVPLIEVASIEPPKAAQPPRPPSLTADAVRAGRGVLAVMAGDPAWPKRFDLTAAGFWRSFFGPALALPLYVFSSALVTRALMDGHPVPASLLWGAAAARTLEAMAFPLLIALIARPMRIGAGYGAFVIVTNWASLYLDLLLALVSLLALGGHDGLQAFSLLIPILLCLSVFFVWRAGRIALSHEVAPVLLVVVLSVAVSAAADEIVQLLG